MKKPICENCGQLVHPASSTRERYSVILLDPPKHCPNCGAKLSHTKRRQVDKYTDYLCILKCIISIGIMSVILIVALIF